MAAGRRKSIPRRIARIGGIVLGSIVLVLVVTLAIALLVVHTDWGRDKVRHAAENALSDAVHGEVEIGRIEGSVLGTLSLHDIVVRDTAGDEVITVDEIDVDYALRPLLAQRFHASALSIDGLEVRAHRAADGSIDLAELAVEDEEESEWSATIDELTVRSATIAISDAATGETQRVEDLDVEAAVRYTPASWTVALQRASARLPALDLTVSARGEIRGRGDALAVRSAVVRAGGSQVVVPLAGADLSTGEVAATAHVTAAPNELARVLPSVSWTSEAAALAAVRREPGGHWSVAVRATGDPGDLALAGELTESPPSIDATLRVERFDPAAAGAGVPGRLAFRGEATARGTAVDELDATLRGTLRGTLAGFRLDRVDVNASFAEMRARAELDARTGRGRAAGVAAIDLGAGEMIIEELSFDGEIPSLSAAAPGAGLAGSATFGVRASGPLVALDATADVAARDVRIAGLDVDIDRLEAMISTDQLQRFRARFDADAGDDLAAHADLVARPVGHRFAIDIRELCARTGALTWNVDAESVVVDQVGRATIEDLTVRSAAAAARVSGRIDARRPAKLRGEVTLAEAEADLGRLHDALGAWLPASVPEIGGHLQAHGELEIGRRVVRGEVRGDDLRWGDYPEVDLHADVGMERRRLDLDAVIANAGYGWVKLEVETNVPRRPTELDAWRRLDRDQLSRVAIELRDLDVGGLAKLAGAGDELTGLVEGEIEIEDGGERTDADLRVRGGMLAPLARGLDVALDARSDATSTHIEAHVSIAGVRNGRVEAIVDVEEGLRALWTLPPGALPNAFLDAPMTADAQLLDMRVRDLASIFDIDAESGGRITAQADVRGTLEAPRGTADVDVELMSIEGVCVGALDVQGELAETRWTARARVVQPRGGRLTAEAAGPLGTPTISARLEARDIRVRPLAALAGQRARGRLQAEIDVDGPIARPQIRGDARLRNGELTGLPAVELVTNVSADVRMDERELRFSASAEARDGTIEIDGSGLLADYYPVRANAEIRAERFPLVLDGQLAEVTTTVRVNTELDDLVVAEAEIAGGEVVVAERLGGVKLHPTGPLEDVVYVDGRADAEPRTEIEPRPVARLDVTTTSAIEVRQNRTAKTEVTADLRVTLTGGGGTSIVGELDTQGGEVMLMERRYRIDRGHLDFEGRMPMNPTVDARVSHEFDEMTLFIDVTGTLDEPEIDLRSDPPDYDRTTLLAIVLGAEPKRAGERDRLGENAARFASAAAARGLSDLVGGPKLVDVSVGTDEAASGVSYVNVGRWVTDDLFVAYRRRFEGDETKNANEVMIEWRIFQSWLIEGTAGDRGAGSADILWVYRF